MKKLSTALVLYVLLFRAAGYCQAGNSVLHNAVSKLKTVLVDRMAENAYLHFDRPNRCYVAGDVVYYKAYVTMGEQHQPTNISGVLHVDMIDGSNNLLQTQLVQLNNGVGWGDILLPDSLQRGTYRIRAYTQWMRNEKYPGYFEQYLSVGSVNSNRQSTSIARQTAQPSLQFFPEGGGLVTDIHSKVAFKVLGAERLGLDVKGVVLDNDNKEVAKITSSHLGMGVFDLTPEAGKTYKAKVVYNDGSQGVIDLPVALAKGIALSVNMDNPAKLSIEINTNRTYYQENQNKQLNLLILCGGAVRTYNPKLDNAVLGLDLDTKDFSSGIAQVILLSETGELLTQRMAFIQNPDMLTLAVRTDKASYAKNENVQLSIDAKDKDGKGINGSFSVAVVNERQMQPNQNPGSSILSYLLLTSQLKDNVEKPNYYFSEVTKQSRADLDIMMLTQNYRRFTWNELLSDAVNTPIIYKAEQNLTVSGILNAKSGAPIVNSKLTLLPDAAAPVLTATDAEGKFRFENLAFAYGSHFILKTAGKNGAVLTLDKPANGPVITPAHPQEAEYDVTADKLAEQKQHIAATGSSTTVQLKQVNIKNTRTGTNYRSSNLSGPGHADQVILGSDLKNTASLVTGLRSLARGIDFRDGHPYLRNIGTLSSKNTSNDAVMSAGAMTGPNPAIASKENMLLVIDGNISNSSVNDINPNTVEAVEILKDANATIYGTDGAMGVMVITTKQGGADDIVESKEMTPGIFSITPVGFHTPREFYTQKYAGDNTGLSNSNNTIWWAPGIITDADGNATAKYPNPNAVGSYFIIVEGMDSKGNVGRQVVRYTIQ